MSADIVHARVVEHLQRLRLGHVAERLDALLSEAARTEPSFLAFLDALLREEVGAKQRKRVSMGITIAHFPAVKTLEDFDFRAQPSVDAKLVRELAQGRFIASAENVLVFGPPGVGKTHLAIGLGRAAVEAGHSVLFTSATALLAALAKAESEGALKDKLNYFAKRLGGHSKTGQWRSRENRPTAEQVRRDRRDLVDVSRRYAPASALRKEVAARVR